METITVKVELSIRRPVRDVFRAVLNPAPFFVKRASGSLEEGQDTTWEFLEVPKPFTVHTESVVLDERIRFTWPRDESAVNTVEFSFRKFNDTTTTVFIAESGWPAEEKWREASYRNCMGWTHMACSLKAFLEYGINLRHGSFVHMEFDE